MEWRCLRNAEERVSSQQIEPQDYKIIIHDSNTFTPSITKSMKENTENLSEQLSNVLRLKMDPVYDAYNTDYNNDGRNLDTKIIECATQHDLPIFISIDGSLNDAGIATVGVCIVAPDIRVLDIEDN